MTKPQKTAEKKKRTLPPENKGLKKLSSSIDTSDAHGTVIYMPLDFDGVRGSIMDIAIASKMNHVTKIIVLQEEGRKAEVLADHDFVAKILAETPNLIQEAERMKLKSGQDKLQLHALKAKLVMKILKHYTPELQEPDKNSYLEKILSLVDDLLSGKLNIATNEPPSADQPPLKKP